jgi:hypothetical protein
MEYMKAHVIIRTTDKNHNPIWTVEGCNGKKIRVTICGRVDTDCKEGKC